MGFAKTAKIAVFALLLGLGSGASGGAQTYPAQSIRLISGFAPGGVTDSVGRILAETIHKKNGQTVITENKPGASGSIATGEIVRAKPDGYTLMVGGFGGQLIPPLIMANYPYDMDRDLTHLAGIAEFMNVMTIRSDLPIGSIQDFVRYAKENPGKLTFGSAGVGTSNYLSAVLFMQKTGVEMTHVPYKGGFGPTTDLIAGHIDVVFENVPIMMAQAGSNRLRVLAVTGRQRSNKFPDTPTLLESGIDVVLTSWIGIYGPPRMAPDLTKAVSDVFVAATLDPDAQSRLKQIGFQPLGLHASKFQAFFVSERARWKEVIEKAGIRLSQ